jgi:hypothetical protein
MKAVHAGLLAVGAALASGLAVWMTAPPPVPVAVPVPAAMTRPLPYDPPGVSPPPAKPSPSPVTRPAPAPAIAAAPPPVYSEPPHASKPVPAKPAPQVIPAKMPAPPVAPVPYQEPTPKPRAPQPTPAPEPEPQPAPELPTRSVTLQPGQEISVRILQGLSADDAQPGDTFQAELSEPLVAGGLVIGESGAPVKGRVVEVQKGGFFGNGSQISLRLVNFLSADGQKVEVSTEPWTVKKVSGRNVVRFRIAARITITERKF